LVVLDKKNQSNSHIDMIGTQLCIAGSYKCKNNWMETNSYHMFTWSIY